MAEYTATCKHWCAEKAHCPYWLMPSGCGWWTTVHAETPRNAARLAKVQYYKHLRKEKSIYGRIVLVCGNQDARVGEQRLAGEYRRGRFDGPTAIHLSA